MNHALTLKHSARRKRHRLDGAQGTSHQGGAGQDVVATIYFATDSYDLDEQDKRVLMGLYNRYVKWIQLRRVYLEFRGYADYRGTEAHNLGLCLKRAKAVAYVFSVLNESPNYTDYAVPMGASEPQVHSTDSAALNAYRRVDVIGPVIRKPPHTLVVPPHVDLKSYRWKVRLLGSVGGGDWRNAIGKSLKGKIGGSTFRLEVVDLDNHVRMEFDYLGFGLSVGILSVGGDSEWRKVETDIPITISDFQGPARHTGVSVQARKGLAVDIIQLLGPVAHGADSVYVGWAGLWVDGTGWSGGTDFGRLANPMGPVDCAANYD